MPQLRADIRIDSAEDLTPWVWDGAAEIMQVSRETAPVDTGRLRDSHSIELVGRNHAAIIVAAPYASYVERGTYKMRAQPYLGPALERGLPLLMRDLARKEAEMREGVQTSAALFFLTAAATAGIIAALQRQHRARERRHQQMMRDLGFETEPANGR